MQIVGVALVLSVIASCMGSVSSPARSTVEQPVLAANDDAVRAVQALQLTQGLAPGGAEKISVDPLPEPTESNSPEPDDTETADPPEPRDSGGKVIYLTFDDGPTTKYTRQVLDLLDEYDAKATFFQLGELATDHPELTRAIVARGHALGNHTWNHKDLRRLNGRKLNRQITRTSAALSDITGRPVTCMRPPYGAVNARVKRAIRRHDLAMKLWDIDPRDWKRPGVKAITRRVLHHAHTGAVNLMHDGGGNRAQSVKALRQILRELSKKGYRFETLPGC
jgi:peptidoglycan-N-acetylglucosamine deacetylase